MQDSVVGPGGGVIFRPIWGPKGRKNFSWDFPPPSKGLDPPMGLLILQWDKKQLTVAWNHTCFTMVLFYKNHSQQQYSTLKSSSATYVWHHALGHGVFY